MEFITGQLFMSRVGVAEGTALVVDVEGLLVVEVGRRLVG